MTAQQSAALLVHRRSPLGVEFLLAHPGGPFWKNKDDGSWSIPKGLIEDGEETHAAAVREFEEEVGQRVDGPSFQRRWRIFRPLVPRQSDRGLDRRR